ncbi:hypothetical protein Q7C36_003064 [Tachysurus vachellii]|uniref:Uncharacterized protein n=1 Tax=Tachysurus vachellii TaxID=175792 RepID=A0AA88T8Y6_TACVA|nr:hypothetical protein Q7C36_003064 [Tachysurus vachellii]
MFIHSNNMEAKVIINECQNLTEASEGMKESRLFQCSCRCLLLMLVTLLGLLVLGLVAHFTVWKEQNVIKSDFTCQDEFGLNWKFNLSGKCQMFST